MSFYVNIKLGNNLVEFGGIFGKLYQNIYPDLFMVVFCKRGWL